MMSNEGHSGVSGSASPANWSPVWVAYRIVQLSIFLSLVWKWEYFVWSVGVYKQIPLSDPFFPDWLCRVDVLAIAFLATLAACIAGMLVGNRLVLQLAAVTSLIGTSILCVHQGSYNDMTFVTAWWTSLWSLWYCFRIGREDEVRLLSKASFLSRTIISMILLGGAVGKWTGEYWSGDVLYEIYFVDRNFWLFNWLRDSFDSDQLVVIAKWYSRFVISTESAAGLFLWLLPKRIAALLAIVLLTSIALFSNFLLFSVLLSLIGLAAVGLFTGRPSCSE